MQPFFHRLSIALIGCHCIWKKFKISVFTWSQFFAIYFMFNTYSSISVAAFRLNGNRLDCCPLKLMYEPGWIVWFAIQSGHFQGIPFCGTFNEVKPSCCTDCDPGGHWNTFGCDIGNFVLTTVSYGWSWLCELENSDGLLNIKQRKSYNSFRNLFKSIENGLIKNKSFCFSCESPTKI